MSSYDAVLAGLRLRATSHYDVVRGPATLDQVQRLRAAVSAQLQFSLPEAYELFLLTCNGFRVDDGRILGVDAAVMASPTPDAPTDPLDGCLAFNLERAKANADAGFTEPFLYLGWYGESAWGVKPDGTCWEKDPETFEDIEQYHDCLHMLMSITKRVDGDM